MQLACECERDGGSKSQALACTDVAQMYLAKRTSIRTFNISRQEWFEEFFQTKNQEVIFNN